MEVTIEQPARQFLKDEAIAPALEERLREHRLRQSLYPWIHTQGPKQFRALLVRMYDQEIELRSKIWKGDHRDDLDLADGIYACAFLIHCCGNPADALVIWKAHLLNQDVGEPDARFLVGAGIEETLALLTREGSAPAAEIVKHIRELIGWGDPLADLRRWRADCQAQFLEN